MPGYDAWKTRVPDDDPDGEQQPDPMNERCPDCGEHIEDPCAYDCQCQRCVNDAEREGTRRLTEVL